MHVICRSVWFQSVSADLSLRRRSLSTKPRLPWRPSSVSRRERRLFNSDRNIKTLIKTQEPEILHLLSEYKYDLMWLSCYESTTHIKACLVFVCYFMFLWASFDSINTFLIKKDDWNSWFRSKSCKCAIMWLSLNVLSNVAFFCL